MMRVLIQTHPVTMYDDGEIIKQRFVLFPTVLLFLLFGRLKNLVNNVSVVTKKTITLISSAAFGAFLIECYYSIASPVFSISSHIEGLVNPVSLNLWAGYLMSLAGALITLLADCIVISLVRMIPGAKRLL